MMRVLHVDPERGWGGGEVQVLGLCERQVAAGIGVLLAVHPAGRLAERAAARGVPTTPLVVRNHVDLVAGWRLRRLARSVDVVHFHTARAHALAPWVAGLGAWRVVTRRMDYVPRGGLLVRLLYERAVDVVIAISEGVRRALGRAGIDPGRVRVVPSGVDLARVEAPSGTREWERRALGIDAGAVVILGVGSLERRKGFDILIAAAARVAGDVHVVLAGDGSERAALESAAASLGVRLRCVGFRDDVAPLLAAADIVAVPSRAEGLGIAALEAMAAARPVVASRVGGLAEVVQEGETGLLVASEDVPALAATLGRLAADAALRDRLGRAAAVRVRERHSLDAMAAGTLACYDNAR